MIASPRLVLAVASCRHRAADAIVHRRIEGLRQTQAGRRCLPVLVGGIDAPPDGWLAIDAPPTAEAAWRIAADEAGRRGAELAGICGIAGALPTDGWFARAVSVLDAGAAAVCARAGVAVRMLEGEARAFDTNLPDRPGPVLTRADAWRAGADAPRWPGLSALAACAVPTGEPGAWLAFMPEIDRARWFRWRRADGAPIPLAAALAALPVDERVAVRALLDGPSRLFEAESSPRLEAAVIALVRDAAEMRDLRAALRTIAPVVDGARVLLDDRSVPDAVERVASWGADVAIHRWSGFAEARNRVQAMVSAPWCVVIDADERLIRAEPLRAAVLEADRAGELAGVDGVEVQLIAVGDRGPGTVTRQVRAYRRARGRWCFPVHNTLVGLRRIVTTGAAIESSYVGSMATKAARTVPVLLEAAAAETDAPRWAYYLAHTYRSTGEMEAALHWAQTCTALAPADPAWSRAWIDRAVATWSLHGVEAADAVLTDAARHHPDHPDVRHTQLAIAVARWAAVAGADGPYASTLVESPSHLPGLPEAARRLGLPIQFAIDAGSSTPAEEAMT